MLVCSLWFWRSCHAIRFLDQERHRLQRWQVELFDFDFLVFDVTSVVVQGLYQQRGVSVCTFFLPRNEIRGFCKLRPVLDGYLMNHLSWFFYRQKSPGVVGSSCPFISSVIGLDSSRVRVVCHSHHLEQHRAVERIEDVNAKFLPWTLFRSR